MISAEQWITWYDSSNNISLKPLIRHIQADVLNYAANICDAHHEPKDGEPEESSNGHANRGVDNCIKAIKDEQGKLLHLKKAEGCPQPNRG